MPAPALINTGTEVPGDGTADLTVSLPTNVEGDAFKLHVYVRNVTTGPTVTGWTLQDGPDTLGNSSDYYFIRDTRSTGGETGTITVNSRGSCHIAVIHTIRDLVETSFIEDQTAGGNGSNDTTVEAPQVDAVSVRRLAVACGGCGDQLTIPSFTGETGGDWLLRSMVGTTLGSNGGMWLQTADLTHGGTISGGSATFAASGEDNWCQHGFALIGTDDPGYEDSGSGNGPDASPDVVATLNGTPQDDELILFIFKIHGSGGVGSTPSVTGVTTQATGIDQVSGTDFRLVVLYRVASGESGASYTGHLEGANFDGDFSVIVFSGVDPSDPIGNVSENSGTGTTATGLDVDGPGRLVAVIGAYFGYPTTNPTNMARWLGVQDANNGVAAFDQPVGSGGTGNKTATINFSTAWAAGMLVLNDAVDALAAPTPQAGLAFTGGMGMGL